MDFDPSDSIIFPQTVDKKMSSKAYMEQIRETPVPSGRGCLWHLGQNSWIFKTPQGVLGAIDPYLTDYCASGRTRVPQPKSRLLPLFIEPEDLQVDLVLITHSHTDHADPFTLERLTIKNTARFLGPWQVEKIVLEAGIPSESWNLMHPLQSWETGDLKITGSFAHPTDFKDLNHMGFVLEIKDGPVYYNSGDTSKSDLLAHVAAFQPKVMSVCINGGYHNLSHWEAAEVCKSVKPQVVLPAHYDMMPHNLQAPHMFRKSLWEQDRTIEYHRCAYYEPYFF